jgi:hypothetical protein
MTFTELVQAIDAKWGHTYAPSGVLKEAGSVPTPAEQEEILLNLQVTRMRLN